MVVVAERALPALEGLATVIKVPPLRVRPTDIAAMQAYFLRERERRTGSGAARRGPRLALTPAALRHIESCAAPPAWTWSVLAQWFSWSRHSM